MDEADFRQAEVQAIEIFEEAIGKIKPVTSSLYCETLSLTIREILSYWRVADREWSALSKRLREIIQAKFARPAMPRKASKGIKKTRQRNVRQLQFRFAEKQRAH